MTDTLRDMLRESVADAEMPDVADAAWVGGRSRHRRRASGVLAGVVVVAITVGGGVWVADRGDDGHASPVQQPTLTPPTGTVSPYRPGSGRYDATWAGVPVWWSPRLAQEPGLPAYPNSPLPKTIDVGQVGRESSSTMPPIGKGLAAFAQVADTPDRVRSVGVLGADGRVRLVDTSRVRPMRDPEGNLRVDAGASMLSPTGAYLMFPQQHSLLVLTLRSGHWRSIDTGSAPTWNATWVGNTSLILPESPGSTGRAPVYSVSGNRVGSAQPPGLGIPGELVGSSQPYGPAPITSRAGATTIAQSYAAGAPVPQPPSLHLAPGASDWLYASGSGRGILEFPMQPGRQKQCCRAASWLSDSTLLYESRSDTGLRLLAWQAGTDRFWNVSDITGWRLGEVSLVTSYASLG